MFAISPTDKNWFDFLKNEGLNSYVNFWTPTPWNVKNLNTGNRLYFMLKSPIRKVGGFGEFVEYKNLTATEAWNKYGYRNGRTNKQSFITSIQEYIDKNSHNFGGRQININTYEIGCIILKNCEYWEENNYVNSNDYNISFPNQIVKIKYFLEYDPFLHIQHFRDDFNLVSEPRIVKPSITNSRDGQGEFKGKILRAYDNRCTISGEIIPELLEAAHIQEYRNKSSNHVQNGLLLRIDLHKLYDSGLIYIDENYTVHVSPQISSSHYRQYHGKLINLPSQLSDYPSITALIQRKAQFRN